MLWYNHLRFDQWFVNGLRYHNPDDRVAQDFKNYGYFSARYLPRNIYYLLLRVPGFERWDHQPSWMGFSLFIQCPVLFLIFGKSESRCSDLRTALWIATGLVSVPILMLMTTGFGQFGARYLFDGVPFLMLLILLREDALPRAPFVILGVLSMVINILGPAILLEHIRFLSF